MDKIVQALPVDKRHVACNGGDGQLGHPRVFLVIDDSNQVTCPYCGQIFVFDPVKAKAKG